MTTHGILKHGNQHDNVNVGNVNLVFAKLICYAVIAETCYCQYSTCTGYKIKNMRFDNSLEPLFN